jgi:hypothetical protein
MLFPRSLFWIKLVDGWLLTDNGQWTSETEILHCLKFYRLMCTGSVSLRYCDGIYGMIPLIEKIGHNGFTKVGTS